MGINVPFLFLTSPSDIAIIAVLVMVLFGAKKLPEMAKGLGEGMKEFKKAVKDVNEEPVAATTTTVPTGTTVVSAPATVNQLPTAAATTAPVVPEDAEKHAV